jgi:hypothetical protein
MLALVIAAVPVAYLNMLNQLAALQVLSGADYLRVVGAEQLNALALLFLDLHSQGLLIVEVFWSLWLLPLRLPDRFPGSPAASGVFLHRVAPSPRFLNLGRWRSSSGC